MNENGWSEQCNSGTKELQKTIRTVIHYWFAGQSSLYPAVKSSSFIYIQYRKEGSELEKEMGIALELLLFSIPTVLFFSLARVFLITYVEIHNYII